MVASAKASGDARLAHGLLVCLRIPALAMGMERFEEAWAGAGAGGGEGMPGDVGGSEEGGDPEGAIGAWHEVMESTASLLG